MNITTQKQYIPVRLSKAEIDNLKASVTSVDPQASLYLFGSRTDLKKRGGDIDFLIISENIKKSDLTDIRWNFFDEFGEQRMDILTDDGSVQTPFVEMVFPKAVKI